MSQPQSQPFVEFIDGLFLRSLCFFGVTLFGVWFANIPTYFNVVIEPRFAQIHWLMLTGVIVLGQTLATDSWKKPLSSQFIAWWIAVVGMNLGWYVAHGGGDLEILLQRVAALCFFAMAYLYFASSDAVVTKMRRALVWVALVSIALSMYDLVRPFSLVPADHEFAHIGRAAGIYVNPNSAGSAIVMAMILSVGIVRARWRASFVALCGIGVILSFSRAAIVAFVIANISLLWIRETTWRDVRNMLLILGLLVLAAVIFFWPLVEELLSADAMHRILWFLDPTNKTDFSQDERVFLAQQGWEQFLRSPLIGNGVGSTEYWVLRGSTHNQFLQFLSDFGFLGCLIMPGLALSVLWRSRILSIPAVVMGCMLFFCIASHNMLTDYFWLVAFALSAAMAQQIRVLPEANLKPPMVKSGGGY